MRRGRYSLIFNMNTELQKEIERVRNLYTADELRDIYSRRLDDGMFEFIGRMVVTNEFLPASVYVRRGFEVLVRGN
jgi:hypothetical protein